MVNFCQCFFKWFLKLGNCWTIWIWHLLIVAYLKLCFSLAENNHSNGGGAVTTLLQWESKNMQTIDQQCLGCGRHTQNCTGVYIKIKHFWDQPAQINKTWLLQRTLLYKMKGCDPMRVPENCLFPGERDGKAKIMQTFDQKCLGSSRHTQNCTGAYNKINNFWAQPAQTNKTWLLQRTPLY